MEAKVTIRADRNGHQLHALFIELLDCVDAGPLGATTEFRPCCLFVPVESGNRLIFRDTRRQVWRRDHGDIHTEVLGWAWAGVLQVGGFQGNADVGGSVFAVGYEIPWLDADGVLGSTETGEGAKLFPNDGKRVSHNVG